jgi:acylphosphatase
MATQESDQPNLVHLIYASALSPDINKDEILQILKAAREKNARLNVTGMLLFDDGDFFQVLEGDSDVVKQLFETIAKDKRHQRVTKILVEPIQARDFPEWTMGYSRISRMELQTIDGLNDFFTHGKSLNDIDKGSATLLLTAFKEGSWRSSL